MADWFSVSDPGDKKSLVDAAEYARLGYDAGATFRLGPSNADWRIIWATTYDVRNGQTHDGGDAAMLSSSLKVALGQASNYAFGVSYDQGRDLQSFESTRVWKLTFGVRR